MNKKQKKKLNLKLVVLFIIVIFIALIFLLRFVIFNNSTNKYGNRLESIKNIKISDTDKKEITDFLTSNEKVMSASVDIKGKIVNVLFTVSDDTSRDDAQKIAEDSLSKFNEKIITNYDIQIFISKKNSTDESADFPLIGYKNAKSDKFVW